MSIKDVEGTYTLEEAEINILRAGTSIPDRDLLKFAEEVARIRLKHYNKRIIK